MTVVTFANIYGSLAGVIGQGTATVATRTENIGEIYIDFLRLASYFRKHLFFLRFSLLLVPSVRETCALMFINFIPSDLRIIQVVVIYTSLYCLGGSLFLFV